MTDRIKGLTLILKKEMREDDCDKLVDALLMFENVVDVKVSVSNADDIINRQRIRMEYFEKIAKVLNQEQE